MAGIVIEVHAPPIERSFSPKGVGRSGAGRAAETGLGSKLLPKTNRVSPAGGTF